MIRTSIGLNSDGKFSAVFRRQSQIFLLFKDRVTLSTSQQFLRLTLNFTVFFTGLTARRVLGKSVSQKLKFLAKLENFSSSLCQFRRLAINDLNMFHFFSSQLLILSAQMANTLVVRLKEWQRDGRLLYLKMPRSSSVEDVWRLLYLKLGKHFQENFFFRRSLLMTRAK